MNYNPYDWYWIKAEGRLYSSAQNSEVGADNALYAAWLALGNLPTPYPKNLAGEEDQEELAKVLAAFGLRVGPLSLEEARAEALEKLRDKRKSVEYGGFEFNGQHWDSEEKDELRLNSTIKLFDITGQSEFPGWKISEGVYITLTPALAANVAVVMAQHYAHAFAVEQVKAVEIEQLQSAEAVRAWLETELDKGW